MSYMQGTAAAAAAPLTVAVVLEQFQLQACLLWLLKPLERHLIHSTHAAAAAAAGGGVRLLGRVV
jgi:hypothetical protein